MKKTLSLILSAVLIISTLISLIIPASAEGDDEGDWRVVLSPYSSVREDHYNPPTPGYYYDETGFHTISPTGYRHINGCCIETLQFEPHFTVISKNKFNIDNFSMTIVVHDYQIQGDNWLSFSLWSDHMGPAQGDTSGKYGDGWTSLMRADPSTGKINRFESWNQTKGGRSGRQMFTPIDDTHLHPVVFEEIINDDGDRVIMFSIEDGVVKVNGAVIGAGTDMIIADRFSDHLAYVCVTFFNSDPVNPGSPTIAITDVNGEIPTGSDSQNVYYCYDHGHLDENVDMFCDLCHKHICNKYGHIDENGDKLCDYCNKYDCDTYGHIHNEKNICIECGFYDCMIFGHYDAGNGDELCDACWTATRRCDGCDCLVSFYPGDRCENCGYLEICDDKIHVDEDNDNYCDSCYDIINIEETTTPSIEIPDTETNTDDTENTEERTTEAIAKDDFYDDSDAPVITIAGCELSASLGIVSIVAIIGTGILIKKKED